jgi:hypothetical protein
MYLPESEFEKNALRQGDILSNTHILGTIHYGSISYLVNPDDGFFVKSKPKLQEAMILSHSCELDREGNGIKVTSIILAPIRDLNSATDKDKIAELKSSNIINTKNGSSYLKYFYLDPHEKLPFSDGAIVDFSKLFSIRNKSYNELLGKKIIQLNEPTINAMSLKLALYFHRKN